MNEAHKDDIVTRLRQNADLDAMEHCNPIVIAMEREAADEIERLREALAALSVEQEPTKPRGWFVIEYADNGQECLTHTYEGDQGAFPLYTSPASGKDAKDAEQKPRELVTLNGKQLKDLLDYAWPDKDDEDQADCEISLIEWPTPFKSTEGDDMPAGLYCYCTEYPEEGIILIDEYGAAK
jgi:hypothetical protein